MCGQQVSAAKVAIANHLTIIWTMHLSGSSRSTLQVTPRCHAVS